jgi:hypothetical protein
VTIEISRCTVVLESKPSRAIKFRDAEVIIQEGERVLEVCQLSKGNSGPHRFVLREFILFNGRILDGKLGVKVLESKFNKRETLILIRSDNIDLIKDINDGILGSQGRKSRPRGTPIASPNKWTPDVKKVRPRQTPTGSPLGYRGVPVRRFGFGQLASPPARSTILRMMKSPQIKLDDSDRGTNNEPKTFPHDLLSGLSAQQVSVIQAVRRGENVFFTGGGGTGKSFLLKKLISLLRQETTAVTASTGIAACNIGGTTVHQFLGIGRVDPAVQGLSQQLAARMRRNADKLQSIKRTKVLIIDEISLIDSTFFELINEILNSVRDNVKPDTVFGGIQLVVCGDFLQLPPVGEKLKFCFESRLWRKTMKKTFHLTQIFRQSEDSDFAYLLNEVRMGDCSDETARRLLSRLKRSKADDSTAPVIKLLPLNKEVASLNERELTRLPKDVEKQTFTAIDTLFDPNFSVDSVCPAKSFLTLPVGARVILVTTLSISDKLVNGATGTVVRFSKAPCVPYIKFDALPDPIGVPAHEWVFRQGNKEMARRRQIPLSLAWGISIHKSQGMTLDACEVSLDKVFEAGQAYVALSRCRSLEGLRLISENPSGVSVKSIQKAVRANPVCVEFYRKINSSS